MSFNIMMRYNFVYRVMCRYSSHTSCGTLEKVAGMGYPKGNNPSSRSSVPPAL